MDRTVLEIAPGALAEYYDWMKAAKSGDILVYWQGDLQYDRQVNIPANDVLRSSERMRLSVLNVVADRVLDDAEDGHVILTQRRIGVGIFEYRATRRVRPHLGSPEISGIRNDDLLPA